MTERPTYSPEPLDEDGIRVYKALIREALLDDLVEVRQLRSIQEYLRLQDSDGALLRERGIAVSTGPMIEDIENEITRELTARVNEINSAITQAPGFVIEVVVHGEPRKIESVVRHGDRVVPVLDGEAYDQPVESVLIHE